MFAMPARFGVGTLEDVRVPCLPRAQQLMFHTGV